MSFDYKKYWNEALALHPGYRHPSSYAVAKEKLFPKNSIVLDLGGGYGTDSLYFLEKGHTVYLFDIADLSLKKALKEARKRGINERLKIKEIDLGKDKIPAEDNFFDVVYSRLSLHYFYPERTVEILKEIYRVLKPGGIAYIVVKSPDDKDEMGWLNSNAQKTKDGVYSERGQIKSRYSGGQYKLFLEKAGVKNFKIGNYIEEFGKEKVFVKSNAEKLLYIEIVFKK